MSLADLNEEEFAKAFLSLPTQGQMLIKDLWDAIEILHDRITVIEHASLSEFETDDDDDYGDYANLELVPDDVDA